LDHQDIKLVIHSGIKLRHIRVFLQIADSAGFTAAAAVLGLSQPAVSKSLAELEDLLGAKLFHRQGRRLALLPAGEAFRRHARDALASLDVGALAISGETGRPRVSVGLLPTVSTRFFPAVVGRFLADPPAVTLSIETGSHPFLVQKLRARHMDLMIGRMPNAPEMAGLDFEYLYEEPIIAVVKAGHPAQRAPIASILRTYPLILPTRESIIRKNVDEYLAALGLSGLDPAVETSTLALGRGLLLASDAVWFISRGVVENEIDAGQLVPIELGATFLSGAVGMTTITGAMVPASIAMLMRLCREAVQTPK
jgi:LysR family transcriptional regulator, pca operon transcriptional activator